MTPSLIPSSRLLLLAASLLHLCSTPISATPIVTRSPSQREFDYVIVGSGPGGSVVANRLSEILGVSVAVIEAGTWAEDVVGNATDVPGYDGRYLLKNVNSKASAIDWDFVTTPQAGVNNQIIRYPRGKALGGSSRLNAMAWGESCRGAFQTWADEVGDQSYAYHNLAQYYKKPARFTPARDGTRLANATPVYDPAEVGHNGPLDVTFTAYAFSWSTWFAVMLDSVGMKLTNAFNDGNLKGSAWHMHTVNQTRGTRASADVAYLRPALARSNLAIFDKTLAERIVFNKKKVATGVQVSSGNSTFTLKARKEVIVAGGVFQSPQLLQVSGVGPKQLLQKFGIPVIADRPGVGQNMQDQIFTDVVYRVNVPTQSTLHNKEADVVAWQTNATGPLSNPGGEFGGFENFPADLQRGFSDETTKILKSFAADWPEIQYLSLPNFLGNLGTTAAPNDGSNYASLMGIIMKPTSRGTISISSSSMHDKPIIDPNWMTTPADLEIMVGIFKRLRQVWKTPAMDNIRIGDEAWPGDSVKTDADIVALLKETAGPMSHATSTNKMGKRSDPLAVVDSHCKVIGVQNLRVIDASAMPFLLPGGEPQAATYMLAEKIADDLKKGHYR